MTEKRPLPQRAKINDVAQLAGVSTATVSRVINGTGTVSDRTAEKVYQAISDLKFVAHGSARGLAGSKTNTIGLILPGITKSFLPELIKGVNDCIHEKGYALLMYSVSTPATMESGNPLPLGVHNTDGLIVFTDFLDDYSIQYFYDHQLPIVMLHRSPPKGLDIPMVVFENELGGYEIVKHLIEKGRRRIVYLKGPEGNEDSRQREVGYHRALKEYGIEFDPKLVGRGNFAPGQAGNAVQKIIDEGVQFDAVFAGNDNAAIGVLETLHQNQIHVPSEVSLVGFDDDYLSQYVNPPLTTVRAPIHQSGFEAAQQLLNLIDGNPIANKICLETEIVVREST